MKIRVFLMHLHGVEAFKNDIRKPWNIYVFHSWILINIYFTLCWFGFNGMTSLNPVTVFLHPGDFYWGYSKKRTCRCCGKIKTFYFYRDLEINEQRNRLRNKPVNETTNKQTQNNINAVVAIWGAKVNESVSRKKGKKRYSRKVTRTSDCRTEAERKLNVSFDDLSLKTF